MLLWQVCFLYHAASGYVNMHNPVLILGQLNPYSELNTPVTTAFSDQFILNSVTFEVTDNHIKLCGVCRSLLRYVSHTVTSFLSYHSILLHIFLLCFTSLSLGSRVARSAYYEGLKNTRLFFSQAWLFVSVTRSGNAGSGIVQCRIGRLR